VRKLACALAKLPLPATTLRLQQEGCLKTGQLSGLSALIFFIASFLGLRYQVLQKSSPGLRVFYDRRTLASGASWLMEIADSLDAARRVVALYTPKYWISKYCKDEFSAAYIRQTDAGKSILFPIYFRSAQIPYLFRTIQYTDCREADMSRVSKACETIISSL
jgi:hypothetical protein